jgi:hypothetical protein
MKLIQAATFILLGSSASAKSLRVLQENGVDMAPEGGLFDSVNTTVAPTEPAGDAPTEPAFATEPAGDAAPTEPTGDAPTEPAFVTEPAGDAAPTEPTGDAPTEPAFATEPAGVTEPAGDAASTEAAGTGPTPTDGGFIEGVVDAVGNATEDAGFQDWLEDHAGAGPGPEMNHTEVEAHGNNETDTNATETYGEYDQEGDSDDVPAEGADGSSMSDASSGAIRFVCVSAVLAYSVSAFVSF